MALSGGEVGWEMGGYLYPSPAMNVGKRGKSFWIGWVR